MHFFQEIPPAIIQKLAENCLKKYLILWKWWLFKVGLFFLGQTKNVYKTNKHLFSFNKFDQYSDAIQYSQIKYQMTFNIRGKNIKFHSIFVAKISNAIQYS